jgi:hypothetical protein
MDGEHNGMAARRADPDVGVDPAGAARAQLPVDVRVDPSAMPEVRQTTHGCGNPHRRQAIPLPSGRAVAPGVCRE